MTARGRRRHLGGGHGQDEQNMTCPSGLAPPGAGDHKRESGRVQHDLDRHQDEDDVTPHQHAEQPQAEQRAATINRVSSEHGHPSSPLSVPVVRGDRRRSGRDSSEHRRQFTPSEHSGPKREAHLRLGYPHRPRSSGRAMRARANHLGEEHERQHERADPVPRGSQAVRSWSTVCGPRLSSMMTKTKSTMIAPA